MLAGIIASLLIGIDDGERMRNAVHPRQMMIGDDQVHAGAMRSLGGGQGADAGVHADNQPHAVGSRALDHFVAHAVAFADAVRHVKISRPAAKLDGRLENDNRGRPVHVVVAVNQNFLFALHCRFQPIQSGFHPAHPQRVVKIAKRRRKKTRSRLRLVDATSHQQIGKHRQSRRKDFQLGVTERRSQDRGLRRVQRIGDPPHEAGLRCQVLGVRKSCARDRSHGFPET